MSQLTIVRSGVIGILLIVWFAVVNRCLGMISQPSDTEMFAGIGILFGSVVVMIPAVKIVFRLTKHKE